MGQLVPDCGSDGAGVPVGPGVEVEVGVDVPVGVAVGVEVEQTQLVADVQDVFRQKPVVDPEAIEQIKLDGQSVFAVQEVLHSGTGVAVGVGVEGVRVKESEQRAGAADGEGLAS